MTTTETCEIAQRRRITHVRAHIDVNLTTMVHTTVFLFVIVILFVHDTHSAVSVNLTVSTFTFTNVSFLEWKRYRNNLHLRSKLLKSRLTKTEREVKIKL